MRTYRAKSRSMRYLRRTNKRFQFLQRFFPIWALRASRIIKRFHEHT